MRKNKLLLLLALLTMLSTRAVAQNDASAMREQMKERIDELKALAPDNVKGLNETLKHDTVKVYIARYTDWYNASPLKSYQDYEDAYDHLGWIIDRVNNYLNAYMEFTDNMAKLKTLIQNFNADTEKKQGYKTFAQNVYNAYKALSDYDMIALDDDNVDDQKEYDYDSYWVEPDDVTSDNIESVADAAGNHEYISTYGQFNAFFSQNTKELGSIYLEVAGTGTAESPENLTAQLKNPDFENADEQWWGTDWTAFGNNLAEHRGNNTFDTYQMVHLPLGYYTLVGYGMDRRGSWEDVLAKDRDWRRDQRTDLYAITDYDGNDTLHVEAFRAKDMALTADITKGAGNISTCEVDGVTYYTPNDMAQYRAWENAKIALTGNGHGALVQFYVWQDEGDFAKLGFVHRWPIDNSWFVADGIQLYYATDNFPDININTPIPAATTYTVSMMDDVKDADKWTVKVGEGQAQALPIGGLKGDGSETVTLQYTGRLKVKGVKATSEAAEAAKEPATVTTAPTGAAIVGVGKTTALVSGGVADGGTLMYAVTTTNTKPASTDGFSDAVPTAETITASGKVYVWYYVKGDDTHSDSEIAATAIEVTVMAVPITVTWNPSDIVPKSLSDKSFTKDGITFTAATCDFQVLSFRGGGTFTTTLGNFTKIEISADFAGNVSGTGWTNDGWQSATWTGNAASVSFSGDIWGGGMTCEGGNLKIVFTIE